MQVLKPKNIAVIFFAITVLFTACSNNSGSKPSDDTSTNKIEPTTPAQDIPTPANDSLTIEGKDSTKK